MQPGKDKKLDIRQGPDGFFVQDLYRAQVCVRAPVTRAYLLASLLFLLPRLPLSCMKILRCAAGGRRLHERASSSSPPPLPHPQRLTKDDLCRRSQHLMRWTRCGERPRAIAPPSATTSMSTLQDLTLFCRSTARSFSLIHASFASFSYLSALRPSSLRSSFVCRSAAPEGLQDTLQVL